jgi:hypothetical protein
VAYTWGMLLSRPINYTRPLLELMQDWTMNVLWTPRTIHLKFEIVILLIRINAYFQYGKSVSRILDSRTLLFMYYNVFIRRRIRDQQREGNISGYKRRLLLHPGMIYGKLSSEIYNILKIQILRKSCFFRVITQYRSAKVNRHLGDR